MAEKEDIVRVEVESNDENATERVRVLEMLLLGLMQEFGVNRFFMSRDNLIKTLDKLSGTGSSTERMGDVGIAFAWNNDQPVVELVIGEDTIVSSKTADAEIYGDSTCETTVAMAGNSLGAE